MLFWKILVEKKLIIGDFYQCIMDVVWVFYELQLFTMRERLIIERSCLLLSNVYWFRYWLLSMFVQNLLFLWAFWIISFELSFNDWLFSVIGILLPKTYSLPRAYWVSFLLLVYQVSSIVDWKIDVGDNVSVLLRRAHEYLIRS